MGEIPIPQEIATSNGRDLFSLILLQASARAIEIMAQYSKPIVFENPWGIRATIANRIFFFKKKEGETTLTSVLISWSQVPDMFEVSNDTMYFRVLRDAFGLELKVGKESISLSERLPFGKTSLFLEYQLNPESDGFDLLNVRLEGEFGLPLSDYNKKRFFPEGRHISIDAILNSILDPENKLGGQRIPTISLSHILPDIQPLPVGVSIESLSGYPCVACEAYNKGPSGLDFVVVGNFFTRNDRMYPVVLDLSIFILDGYISAQIVHEGNTYTYANQVKMAPGSYESFDHDIPRITKDGMKLYEYLVMAGGISPLELSPEFLSGVIAPIRYVLTECMYEIYNKILPKMHSMYPRKSLRSY